jgi:putative membrane protein
VAILPGMLQALAHFALTGISVLIVAALLPGMRVRSYFDAFAFAVVVGILNVIAWKVLFLITLPFAFLTVGIGYFVINGLIFLVAQKVVRGVEISGCFIAAIAAVLVGLVNSGITALFK